MRASSLVFAAIFFYALCSQVRAVDADADIRTLDAEKAYAMVWEAFAKGDQSQAEELAAIRLEAFPAERKSIFLNATFKRSRFYKREPAKLFRQLIRQDPNDAIGRCAAAVLALDRGDEVENSFRDLQAVIDANPNEPLYLWLMGIECREHSRNAQGAEAYARLCKLVKPGGALIHQTYANLLDELEHYDEALVHRQLTVQLEPASWSYNGLGNTLHSMGRYAQADPAYAEAARLNPKEGCNFAQWGSNDLALKRYASALKKFDRAEALGYKEAWVDSYRAKAADGIGSTSALPAAP